MDVDAKPNEPPPSVFMSHAHADKDRFVRRFAERLYSDGVNVWIDEWDMLPGDSHVQKLFEEAIPSAQAMVVVVSKHSIQSKWVRAELDAAFVRRVEDGVKIIPVVLDGVDVPETLRSTLHVKINNIDQYDEEYARILRHIG